MSEVYVCTCEQCREQLVFGQDNHAFWFRSLRHQGPFEWKLVTEEECPVCDTRIADKGLLTLLDIMLGNSEPCEEEDAERKETLRRIWELSNEIDFQTAELASYVYSGGFRSDLHASMFTTPPSQGIPWWQFWRRRASA